ncbi:hypothetical protein VP01_167g2 [Puccinia sorghi]|uniref:Uncharacterized protein n=1 Tax=Puccinia sorghi TaxID=27349 RepID=A0A0L6VG06_9BASI|nr:hypothetical protein VP01_167g2 [Puccinia sorghi]
MFNICNAINEKKLSPKRFLLAMCHITCYSTKHLLIHINTRHSTNESLTFLKSNAITHFELQLSRKGTFKHNNNPFHLNNPSSPSNQILGNSSGSIHCLAGSLQITLPRLYFHILFLLGFDPLLTLISIFELVISFCLYKLLYFPHSFLFFLTTFNSIEVISDKLSNPFLKLELVIFKTTLRYLDLHLQSPQCALCPTKSPLVLWLMASLFFVPLWQPFRGTPLNIKSHWLQQCSILQPLTLQKKLAPMPAVEQKVQQSFGVIQPSFDAQSPCRLHSDCAKKYTYANRWSLDVSLVGACYMCWNFKCFPFVIQSQLFKNGFDQDYSNLLLPKYSWMLMNYYWKLISIFMYEDSSCPSQGMQGLFMPLHLRGLFIHQGICQNTLLDSIYQQYKTSFRLSSNYPQSPSHTILKIQPEQKIWTFTHQRGNRGRRTNRAGNPTQAKTSQLTVLHATLQHPLTHTLLLSPLELFCQAAAPCSPDLNPLRNNGSPQRPPGRDDADVGQGAHSAIGHQNPQTAPPHQPQKVPAPPGASPPTSILLAQPQPFKGTLGALAESFVGQIGVSTLDSRKGIPLATSATKIP